MKRKLISILLCICLLFPIISSATSYAAAKPKLSKSKLNLDVGEGIPMNEVFDMLEEYDFSQGIKNPYMKRR